MGAWNRIEGSIQEQMNAQLAEVKMMRQEALAESDAMVKAHMLLQCERAYVDVNHKSRNVESIGNQLDIDIGLSLIHI